MSMTCEEDPPDVELKTSVSQVTRENAVSMARSLRNRGIEGQELRSRLADWFSDPEVVEYAARRTSPRWHERPPARRRVVSPAAWWLGLSDVARWAIVGVVCLAAFVVALALVS